MSAMKQTKLSARGGPVRGTAVHWIGGWWLDSGEHSESINPATGEVIGGYAMGGRKEAELAVKAALRAFRKTDWKDNRSLRARVLNAMAARFEAGTVPFNLTFQRRPAGTSTSSARKSATDFETATRRKKKES